jgi:Xaa-Pro aminopeptidase
VTDRIERCRLILDALALDALVVSDATDVRYLSGFRGEDAMLVIGREAGLICTDSRFWAQVREEVPALDLVKTDLLLDDVVRAAAEACGERATLGFRVARSATGTTGWCGACITAL